VVYGNDGNVVWGAQTQDHPGSYFVVQNDGNAVVYDANGQPLWATKTRQ
jgi:hypothetical protein